MSWQSQHVRSFRMSQQELIGMVLTQLTPWGTYPTRVIMLRATNTAIVERKE